MGISTDHHLALAAWQKDPLNRTAQNRPPVSGTLDIKKGGRMTPEEHKAIVRRFFEDVWNKQRLEVVDEVFAAAVLLNGQPVPRETIKQVVTARRVAFPDIQVAVEDQVAEGDKVSTRRTWQATHRGPYRGIAATGKRVKWAQISIVRLVEGRIVEDWPVADELSILQQLGHLPG